MSGKSPLSISKLRKKNLKLNKCALTLAKNPAIIKNMSNPEKKSSWLKQLIKRAQQEFRWLAPGMGYKRWLVLTIVGSMLLGLGAAVLVLDYYRSTTNEALVPILAVLSLRFLDRPIRFLLFGGLGMAMILIGIWGANRSLLRPFEKNGKPVWDTLKNYRQREKGIKVVVIGGGHGLAALLRGLKEYTHNITAIVTVADNGGSSGELRRDLGVLPPGDIRNCLSALSSDEALLSQVFQYRFTSGGGLEGLHWETCSSQPSVKSPAVLKKQSRSPARFLAIMDRYCLRH